jgi:hypothetical protein
VNDVFWFLLGDRTTASSRLQGYLIHESLVASGYKSHLIFAPKTRYSPWGDFKKFAAPPWKARLTGTISIIQKLRGSNTNQLINWLKRSGSRVVYVNCDLEESNTSWHLADTILATSEPLCQYHREHADKPVSLIREPYEYSFPPPDKESTPKTLQILWFGYGEHWQALLPWKRILETRYPEQFHLVTCSDHPEATHRWSPETQRRLILESDLAIFPTIENECHSVKSPNRLIQSMACGLPAIVGPRPSYQSITALCPSVIEAFDESSFVKALETMADARNRRYAALHAYEYAHTRHSRQAVMQDWISLLGVQPSGAPSDHALVSLQRGIACGGKMWSLRQKMDRITSYLTKKHADAARLGVA